MTAEHTNQDAYAPDSLNDCDIAAVDEVFALWMALTLTMPTAMRGLITLSWSGVRSAFVWGGLAAAA